MNFIKKYAKKQKKIVSVYYFCKNIKQTLRPFYTIYLLLILLFSLKISLSFKQRIIILIKFHTIDRELIHYCSVDELLLPTIKLLKDKTNRCIVECGTFKGGSTAKLSIIAKLTNRTLFVCDSFEGLPANEENKSLTYSNYTVNLSEGNFKGTIEEVKQNLKKYGCIDNCIFIKGYYEQTLPSLYITNVFCVFSDVDLYSSNVTCLKYLLNKTEYYFSQDYHFPKVRELFINKELWLKELNIPFPTFKVVTERFGYFNNQKIKIEKVKK